MPKPPPIVTGISPKEGPPGTRVTIRGENLGTTPRDLIGLTICGVDCVMSAEWVSPKKIIARSGSGKGRGDVIVTTMSGGHGTCTVQFKGVFEAVGLLKESAVWVDDTDLLNITSWGRKRPTSPSQLHQDNPLGLSDEGIVKKFPEEMLQELFPDGSGNLTLENFNPAWYLLENHNGVSFDDLNRGLDCLRHKVSTQIEGELSFLKANVRSIMDQLDTLNALSHTISKYKEEETHISTDPLEEAIVRSKSEADTLFEDVLGRKDKADATRNALSVLQRFKFLFNLPCNIERNIQKGDYDVVINDYARAKSLFADTEVQVFKKVYQEVELRITNFREILSSRLKELPLSLEEQKRLVRYLVNLETPGDPAWDCITYQHNFIIESLNSCKNFHINQDLENSEAEGNIASNNNNNNTKHWSQCSVDNIYNKGNQWQSCPPSRVMFVEELSDTMGKTFPDLWKLGQAYFKGDLNQKDISGGKIQKTDAAKQTEFKRMVLDAINLYSDLYRSAILSHTLAISSVDRKALGIWPSSTSKEVIGGWLPHCLRYIRNCYSNFINLDLPGDALQIIQKLIFDMRVYCMNVMFRQATEDVRNLHIHESWSVEVDEDHGGTTQLPILYENIVIEILQLVKETAFQLGTRELDLFMDKIVNSQIINHIQKLLQAFAETLDILAFTKESVIDSSENISETNADILSQDEKLMIVLSNCNYTAQNILPKFDEALQKNGYPNVNSIISFSRDTFHNFHDRVFEAYMELKSDPIVGAIEQNMYTGRFDWANCVEPNGVRAYVKEIMHAIIAVHAEVFAISPVFVTRIIVRLVEIITEELSRLFSCVQRFSLNGSLQAKIDLHALLEALSPYTNNTSKSRFKEAFDNIPTINNPRDKKLVEDNLNNFKSNMKIQLMCFRCSSNQG